MKTVKTVTQCANKEEQRSVSSLYSPFYSVAPWIVDSLKAVDALDCVAARC